MHDWLCKVPICYLFVYGPFYKFSWKEKYMYMTINYTTQNCMVHFISYTVQSLIHKNNTNIIHTLHT